MTNPTPELVTAEQAAELLARTERGGFNRFADLHDASPQLARTVIALHERLAAETARALLDGIAMSETAMARDRAMTNLEHWRQEVGKLHSQLSAETARADAAEARVAVLEGAVAEHDKSPVERSS